MSEHPQQTDRALRDTRILTLRIWAVVGCIVIAAVIFNLMGILAPVIEFLAVGSIIAFVMSPITNWLEHHGGIAASVRLSRLLWSLLCSSVSFASCRRFSLVRSWKSLAACPSSFVLRVATSTR